MSRKPRIAFVTDSTACLSQTEIDGCGGTLSVVRLSVEFDGDVISDGVLEEEDFFSRLARAKKATTSAPDTHAFVTAYQRLLEAGTNEILSILLTAEQSEGTVTSARAAKGIVLRDYPKARIHIWDSQFVSAALGWQALHAVEMARNGAGVEDILPELDDMRSRSRLIVVLDTLEYLRRGGRIGRAKRWLGAILRTKPILALAGGCVVPVERPRTKQLALRRLVEHARTWGTLERVVVSSGMARQEAQQVSDLLTDGGIFPGPIPYIPITSTLAVHAGPKVVAIIALKRKD